MSGKPAGRSGRGREAHAEVREGSGSPPGGLGGVGRPTQKFGRGREVHPEVRVGLGGTPGGP